MWVAPSDVKGGPDFPLPLYEGGKDRECCGKVGRFAPCCMRGAKLAPALLDAACLMCCCFDIQFQEQLTEPGILSFLPYSGLWLWHWFGALCSQTSLLGDERCP